MKFDGKNRQQLKNRYCISCSTSGHSSRYCGCMEYTFEEKFNVAKGFCLFCFKDDHISDQCFYKGCCAICGHAHNINLHSRSDVKEHFRLKRIEQGNKRASEKSVTTGKKGNKINKPRNRRKSNGQDKYTQTDCSGDACYQANNKHTQTVISGRTERDGHKRREGICLVCREEIAKGQLERHLPLEHRMPVEVYEEIYNL